MTFPDFGKDFIGYVSGNVVEMSGGGMGPDDWGNGVVAGVKRVWGD